MKQIQAHINSNILRFRRWSRKGFALFVSVSFVVNIGVLAVSVSDKSSLKSSTAVECFTNSNELKAFEDDEDVDIAIAETFSALIETKNQNDCAAAYGLLNILLNVNGCYCL